MKKIIRMSLFILIISLCTCFYSVNVNAKETTITLTKKTYIYTNNRKDSKFYTTKGYAYCITPGKVGAQEGQKFSFKSKTADKGLIYLLDNAKPSNDHSYLVTQLAIWKYYNGGYTPEAYKGTKINTEANKLAEKAKNASPATTKITIDLKVTSSELFLNNDSTYYKSANMKANVSGASTYTVNVQGPEKIQLMNSEDKVVANNSTFKSGEVFYVRIAVGDISQASKIIIKVTAKGKTSIVKRYTPNNNKLQELILIDNQNCIVGDSSTLTVNPVKRSCEYVNGIYYDKDGKVTDQITYSIQCEKHTCEKVGETYFGKDSTIVDESTYRKECEKHICEKVDDTYYGKDGSEVDSVTYTKECEKHTCEIIDNTYFDKLGNQVDYEKYKSDCMHFCELYKNNYYGKNGTIVDEKTYKDECTTPVVPVPDTDTDPLDVVIYLLLGSLLLLSGFYVITPNTKKM